MIWRVAGKLGVDPGPMTVRDLFEMYVGKIKYDTDLLAALVGKPKRNKKPEPKRLVDSNGNMDMQLMATSMGLGMPPHLQNKEDDEHEREIN